MESVRGTQWSGMQQTWKKRPQLGKCMSEWTGGFGLQVERKREKCVGVAGVRSYYVLYGRGLVVLLSSFAGQC